jgi:phosphoglycerate dehydrogenase-like enzyme
VTTSEQLHVVVAGVPRSYQRPFPDGRWLTPEHEAAIRAVGPGIRLTHTCREELERGHIPSPDPDVLLVESCGRKRYGEELPEKAFASLVTPRLRWIQACSSGVGHILELGLLPESIPLTNAGGVHARALGESVMAAVLFHSKRLRERLENQERRLWTELHCTELHGKTMCVLGAGHIGVETARRARAFGIETIGIRRTPRPSEAFDAVEGPARLKEVLARSDFIVVACPLTPETEGMIGQAELRATKRGAYLINVARGRVTDEQAVLRAVRAGQLRGAFLDAFGQEPLPPEHPFWAEPGITVTPHDSHSSELIGDNIVALFTDNLRRFLNGEPLRNLVDPARGY